MAMLVITRWYINPLLYLRYISVDFPMNSMVDPSIIMSCKRLPEGKTGRPFCFMNQTSVVIFPYLSKS